MNLLYLLALALAPGATIIIYIYLKDKYEPEPIGLLLKSFLYGCLSVVLTLIISLPIDYIIPIDEKSISEQAVHAFLMVALIEEFSKFIFVRCVLYYNTNFNEPFDGIVYAVMVSMGFATFENIMYAFDGGFSTAVFRMFTAVPAHATFAILMGYYLGKAKFEEKKSYYAFYALGIATLFHGAYDYFLFIDFVPGIALGAFASLLVGIWLSRKAIRTHQLASPFRKPASASENDPPASGSGGN
jgi:protease PrsW